MILGVAGFHLLCLAVGSKCICLHKSTHFLGFFSLFSKQNCRMLKEDVVKQFFF